MEKYLMNLQKLIDAAKEANEFFKQNDDFTENGEFPIPKFIQNLRNAIEDINDNI
mgnify:CR=1 FL=1